jgi:DNA-binding protein YbaB
MTFKLKARTGGDQPIKKFTTVGEVVEGVYHGRRQGDPKYKPLILIGDVALTPKKQLEDHFADIRVGTLVRVTFLGKIDIKGGKTMNTFSVEVDEDVTPTEDYATLAAQLSPAVRRAIEDMFTDPAQRLERVKAALVK